MAAGAPGDGGGGRPAAADAARAGPPGAADGTAARLPEAAEAPPPQTVEGLKEEGNLAFKRAQVLRRTTAGKQYLNDAKACYIQALTLLGGERADERALALACALHCNLAAVFLQEVPPKWQEAKAAADIALSVEPQNVKALYRRAQAVLEDGREGLVETALRAALADLDAAAAAEPANAQVAQEASRIRRRIDALEAARRVPPPEEVIARVPVALRDRGGDCLAEHGYVWGQTEAAVHLFVPARGARISRASLVTVEIRPRSLRLALPATVQGEGTWEVAGDLHRLVRPDDCSWQLDEGGLVLHVELAKLTDPSGDDGEGAGEGAGEGTGDGEHWACVWRGHPETTAPSAKERRRLQQMATAAGRAAAATPPPDKHPKQEETLRRFREMCPGVDVEWGDTSLDALRD